VRLIYVHDMEYRFRTEDGRVQFDKDIEGGMYAGQKFTNGGQTFEITERWLAGHAGDLVIVVRKVAD
jgi:hypothetical protein